MTITSLHGDCLDLLPTLEVGSIQALVTSPPYYGLRQYAIPPSSWHAVEYTPMIGLPPVVVPPMVCQLGAEPDPLAYIGHLVHVFRLARPALRTDATLWVNLGDSYASTGKIDDYRRTTSGKLMPPQGRAPSGGIPDKNLLGIPARAALALQADGWIWRNDIIWHAPNKMPESVRDRFTRAHEDVLLFGNSARYYFDQDEVREPHKESSIERQKYALNIGQGGDAAALGKRSGNWKVEQINHPAGRNRRDVWSIPTSPMPAHLRNGDEAHYAAWPPALAEIMVKAASANKACGTCGAAWVRRVERESASKNNPRDWQGVPEYQPNRNGHAQEPKKRGAVGTPTTVDLGFAPACACAASTARCVVLDPFAGTGTTLQVSESLGRDSIGIDLGYQSLQERRTDGIQIEMEAYL